MKGHARLKEMVENGCNVRSREIGDGGDGRKPVGRHILFHGKLYVLLL